MEKINCYRVKIAQKGYILPSELGKYAGISDAEGFQLYQKLKEMLRPKSEIPFVTIVTVKGVNDYLGLNQNEIYVENNKTPLNVFHLSQSSVSRTHTQHPLHSEAYGREV